MTGADLFWAFVPGISLGLIIFVIVLILSNRAERRLRDRLWGRDK